MCVIQREFKAAVGGVLLKTVGKAAQNRSLKNAGLKSKSAALPSSLYTMHYLEQGTPVDGKTIEKKDQPTIIFFIFFIESVSQLRILGHSFLVLTYHHILESWYQSRVGMGRILKGQGWMAVVMSIPLTN
jgi:hypothetical protein